MEQRQWLLIGGPAQGQVVTVDASCKTVEVPHPATIFPVYSYHATHYVQGGTVYRLGICRADGPEPEKACNIPAMIAEAGLKPVVEVQP